MAFELRQSTAGQIIPIGPFLDDEDGVTPRTDLTIANTDIKLWKHGATSEVSKNSGGALHMSNGRYYLTLDATDTNTVGNLEINIHVAGALPVRRECVVRPANVYDSLTLGTDKLQVDAVEIEGSDATNQIRDSVVDDQTRIDASALNTLSGHDPGETLMGATTLGTGEGLTSLAPAATALSNEVWTDTRAGHLDNLASAPPDAEEIADAVWDEAQEGHTGEGTFGAYLDSAVSGVSTGGLSASDIAEAIWEDALSGGHFGAEGSIGKLIATNLDAAVSTRSTYAGGDTPGTTALLSRLTSGRAAALDNLDASVSSRLASSAYSPPPDAEEISAQVAEDLAEAHGEGAWTTATGFSTLTTDDIPTAAAIADKILGRSLAGGSDGGRTVRDALRFLRNRWVRGSVTLTVYAEDDSTPAWSSSLTTQDDAEPVVQSNPA